MPNTKFQDNLKNPNKDIRFLKETIPNEISIIISNFDQNKGSDIYGISNLLTIIFNKSIQDGIFTEALKVSTILPLHKRVIHYLRSLTIDLLPIISNIFEIYYIKPILYFQKNKST